MTAYDKLNTLIYDLMMLDEETCFDAYAIYLIYSHDNKDFTHRVEVCEIDPCNQTITWFNDWYEGQPFIKMLGYVDIETVFAEGDYNVLVQEFKDA